MAFVEKVSNTDGITGRLTPFEEYMLVDGLAAYPMSCYISLRFRGRCDEAILKDSMADAVKRHPLLRSLVWRKRRGVYFWREAEPPIDFRREQDGPIDSFYESVGDSPDFRRFRFAPSFEAGGIDLFHAPALRINYWTNGNDSSAPECYLFIELHHSASDATGFFRFLEDALIEYANRTTNAGIPLPDYDLALSAKRNTYHRTLAEKWRMFPRQLYGLERARTFLGRRVRPLAVKDAEKTATEKSGEPRREVSRFSPVFLSNSWSPLESARIKSEAKRRGLTLNDAVLAAAFWGMRDALDDPRFLTDGVISPGDGYLRIAVPMNLRNRRSGGISAANLASMVFVDRRKRKITDDENFIRGIHREMVHIKENELGFAFIHGLTFFKRLLGGFSLMCGGRRSWTTGTVSNLGVLFPGSPLVRDGGRLVVGELELLDVQAAPPIRHGSVFGVSVESYAGELHFGMQYDAQILSPKQAEILFAAMENHLRPID